MTSENHQQGFFPKIGSVAETTDLLPEDIDDQQIHGNDDIDRPLQEIESLCMNCEEQGTTRMLLTSIPFFREVIIMSFRCEYCNNENNEVMSAGIIRDQGAIYTVKILDREDLNRQIVKSETAEIVFLEFEFTIPPQRGQLTTVEGLLRDAVKDLSVDQALRRAQNLSAFEKIQSLLETFQGIINDTDEKYESEDKENVAEETSFVPFTLKLDDPAGNSFIEFRESMTDPKWNLRQYKRSPGQDTSLGFVAPTADDSETHKQISAFPDTLSKNPLSLVDEMDAAEVFIFPGACPSCRFPLDTRMKKVTIPYFKDILLMSTNCENCGYKDNEVKSAAHISEKGKRITLKIEDADDLNRDVLKSETCGLSIPEIDLVLQPGTLGGRFTTVEGILEQVYDELSEKVFTDSATSDSSFVKFLASLKSIKSGKNPFTLILDDPLANSYLQSLYAPDPDPNMTIELYDRTYEQNDDLGINDMKLEGYEEEHAEEMKRLRLGKEGET